MLYPLKFKPILKERIWGGSKLRDELGKRFPKNQKKYGESWELSSVEGDLSVVTNGFLAGNNIEELIEVYMGDLVGDRIYQKYGLRFPLLVKFIDSNDFLSVQVHPNDNQAMRLHNSYGKSEMWYIIDSQNDSKIVTGFNGIASKEDFQKALINGTIANHLHYEHVKPNDIIYIPSGGVHSLGKGIMLVEIQQTSDITYRIYDWDRVEQSGKPRELHVDLAADAINFQQVPMSPFNKPTVLNMPQELIDEEHFVVNRIDIDSELERDILIYDTFRIYLCTEGVVEFKVEGLDDNKLEKGELLLVPASINSVKIVPFSKSAVLEIYIR